MDRYFQSHAVRKLQVGSGDNLKEGWLNTNYMPGVRQTSLLHLDATERFPFPNDSFDYVNSEHMIEHVPHEGGRSMLNECFRVMKCGGRIRITTPDIHFLVQLLRPALSDVERRYVEWAHRSFIGAGEPSAVAVVNHFVRSWGHLFIYDRPTLERDLREAGFTKTEWLPLNESSDENLRGLEHTARMPEGLLELESMTCEGVKP
jgi:predicted SAM-dependent methyltransferase